MGVSTQPEAPSRRVVIAEDEALIRLDLAEMLAEEGYDVVGQAGDGEKAVALAEELRPDLVVLDVKMPKLDGITAAQRIAEQRIAPVVILTAFSQRELVERARAAGAMAYLVKPFQKSDLVPAIEIALSRFAELAALEQEVATLNERLETRKIVERAKGQLMSAYGMTEPQAFKWIQRNASGSLSSSCRCRTLLARSTALRVSSRSERSATSVSRSWSSANRDTAISTAGTRSCCAKGLTR